MTKFNYFCRDFFLAIGDIVYEQHSVDDTSFYFELERVSEFLYNCDISFFVDGEVIRISIHEAPLPSVVSFINNNLNTYI